MSGSLAMSKTAILRLAFGGLTASILLSVVPSLLAAGPNLGGYLDVDRSPWLFDPFAIVPAVAWWAAPMGLTAWALWRLRPTVVVWPMLALCVVWPPTVVNVASGSPVLWVMAAVAVGLVAVPDSWTFRSNALAFDLWVARRRRWWIVVVAFVATCLAFGAMWEGWLTTVISSVGGGLSSPVQGIPMVSIGIVAWLGRTRVVQPQTLPRKVFEAGAQMLICILIVYLLLTFAFLSARGYVADIWLKDYSLYMEATRSWLHGGPFYLPEQIAGPYDLAWGQVLYPPVLLVLFVPSLFLPALIWLVVPLAVTTIAMVAHRPNLVAWACVLGLIAMDPMQLLIYPAGNPTIWLVMVMALATHRPWISALILVKPSLTPFGLAGIRDRRWWVVVACMSVVSLALWTLTLEWIAAMRNLQGAAMFYALVNLQVMIIPIVAWLGRSRIGAATLPEARRSWVRPQAAAPDP